MVYFTKDFCKYLAILESTRQLFLFFNLEYKIFCDSAFIVSGAEILDEVREICRDHIMWDLLSRDKEFRLKTMAVASPLVQEGKWS